MATIKFYQVKAGTKVETFAVSYEIKATLFNKNLFAANLANKLMKFSELKERAQKNGSRLSFSPSKPMWFEWNSGAQKVESSEAIAKQFGCYIKGKKGQNMRTKSQIKEDILILLDTMKEATEINYAEQA